MTFELSCSRAFLCSVGSNHCVNGTATNFYDAVSLLAVSGGAACFALAAEEGQRLLRFGRGGLLTGWVAFFVGLVLIANSFPPAELSLLGKQLAVLFLGPLYGFGLFAVTKLLSNSSMKSSRE